MIDINYFLSLKKNLHLYQERRRDVIEHSNAALHVAKRVIFDLHKRDKNGAQKKMKEVEEHIKKIRTMYKKYPDVSQEGAYKAAIEEYVEATLFFRFVTNKEIGKISSIPMDDEVYLAGLCDLPGELLRYGLRAATEKDIQTLQRCLDTSNAIIGALTEFNLTKYLRTKFDQAKNANHKLEFIVYEVSLRHL